MMDQNYEGAEMASLTQKLKVCLGEMQFQILHLVAQVEMRDAQIVALNAHIESLKGAK